MTLQASSSVASFTSAEASDFDFRPSTLPSSRQDALAPFWPPNEIVPITEDDLLDTSVNRPADVSTLSLRHKVERKSLLHSVVEVLAEWDGCVTFVEKGAYAFSAILTGIAGEGVRGEEEEAVIPIADVSEWDKDLLRPGNFFRLCVIYEILPSGQPRRYTQVVFRRLPAYRQQDLDQAAEQGRLLARGLRVE